MNPIEDGGNSQAAAPDGVRKAEKPEQLCSSSSSEDEEGVAPPPPIYRSKHVGTCSGPRMDAFIHQELQSYLGNVLNETLALRSFESMLHAGINTELERRDQLERLKAERIARGEYAFTAADEAEDKEKRKNFNQFIAKRKADLNVWTRTYRGHVTALILKLALHPEISLQTLAFRLDYSDFYKRGDAKLHEPLTYQHKRLSEIGLNQAKGKFIDRSKKK